jgi:hypothetical protein
LSQLNSIFISGLVSQLNVQVSCVYIVNVFSVSCLSSTFYSFFFSIHQIKVHLIVVFIVSLIELHDLSSDDETFDNISSSNKTRPSSNVCDSPWKICNCGKSQIQSCKTISMLKSICSPCSERWKWPQHRY